MKKPQLLKGIVKDIWDFVLFAALQALLVAVFMFIFIFIMVKVATNG